MRRSGFRSAALLLVAAAVFSPAGAARPDAASCGFEAPAILDEPSHTRGTSNTIRWELVPSSCWENDDSAGKKSKDRRFVVTITNEASGETETVTVHGDGEVDATVDPDELPAGPNGAIDGQRFSYTVVRKESICYSGSPSLGICTHRDTRTSQRSREVVSIQDARSPSGSLLLGNGETFTRTLEVRAAVTATDPGGAASGPGYVSFAGAVEGCRLRASCHSVLGSPLSVRLAAGADGPRIVEAQVYDRARGPADDPGLTTIGRPPGNVSSSFNASIVLDRTAPQVFLRVSTSRPTVGVAVTFDASSSVDLGGGSGVEPTSGEWTFGDGGRANGLVATHTFTQTGTFPIGFSVSDRVGNVVRIQPGSLTVSAAPVQAPPLTTSSTPAQTPPAKADRTPPALSALAVKRRGKRATLSFRVSERATVRLELRRLTPRPARRLATLSRTLRAGRNGLALPAAVRKPGRYQLVLVARDAAGNASRPRTVRLTTRR